MQDMYTCMYACMCVWVYAYMSTIFQNTGCTRMQVWMHVYIYIYICLHMNASTISQTTGGTRRIQTKILYNRTATGGTDDMRYLPVARILSRPETIPRAIRPPALGHNIDTVLCWVGTIAYPPGTLTRQYCP